MENLMLKKISQRALRCKVIKNIKPLQKKIDTDVSTKKKTFLNSLHPKKNFASLRSLRDILHLLLCNLFIRHSYAEKVSWIKEILAKYAKTQRY